MRVIYRSNPTTAINSSRSNLCLLMSYGCETFGQTKCYQSCVQRIAVCGPYEINSD